MEERLHMYEHGHLTISHHITHTITFSTAQNSKVTVTADRHSSKRIFRKIGSEIVTVSNSLRIVIILQLGSSFDCR